MRGGSVLGTREQGDGVFEKTTTIKGSALKPMMAYMKKTAGAEGFARLLAALPAETRRIVDIQVSTSGKYPVVPFLALMNQFVKDCLGGNPERLKDMGKFIMDDGLNSIYRLFLRAGNPAWLISKASMLFSMYHSQGAFEPFNVTSRSGYARMTHPHLDVNFCRCQIGAIIRGLELVGCKDVVVKHEKCIGAGDECCIYSIQWNK